MEKSKVIIWGTGSGFFKREEKIREIYQIIAFTDNGEGYTDFLYKDQYIAPEELKNWNYDHILVCSLEYFETIKYRLINMYRIPSDKIKCAEIINMFAEDNKQTEQIIYNSIKEYENMENKTPFKINPDDMQLIAYDYISDAGIPHQYYFAQDIWAARKICLMQPKEHYDIGSRLDGFIGHLLAGLGKVNYIDIRPLPYFISGLEFFQADATNLENIADNSLESLSSLHAVEHFGLGRYGDSIDPYACFKAMKAFSRVLRPGGKLYFAVPIGPSDKLVFNAHRIFHPMTIINAFKGLKLKEFAIIVGYGTNAEIIAPSMMDEYCRTIPYNSCGLFEFEK